MPKKPTILIVDDTKENIAILLSLLSDYDVVVALNGQKALKVINNNEVDLILLDIMMPGMDGYEVCEILKSQNHTKDIPILFITAKTDEDSIEKGYDVGGIDYITKPFKPKELLARIKTHLQLSETLKSLEYLATRDPMTGAYNRRKFFELGEEYFTNTNELFAAMIDIDKFKNVNDTYGHPFGDIIIKSIVKTIQKHILDNTILGRLGGEEFGIIYKEYSLDEVKKNVEMIRKSIADSGERCGDKIVKFTISNGIAKKDSDNTLDKLLIRADKALYDAKKSGRNKVCFRERKI